MYEKILIAALWAHSEVEAVELLKDLTADQRVEMIAAAHRLTDAVERAQKESGDL